VNFIKKLFKNTFERDILILMLVSIIVGSVLAASVSLTANAYFSKTLANLVGDYGEYDLIINVREEMKDDAAQQLQKIIDDAFPGAKLKEGPTLTGKTSFFVALPEQYKTKKIYEDLGKTFGSIPGGAGIGFMTEPRITVRGVPEGAKNMIVEKISQMDGVKFAFRDGASVGVLLTGLDKVATVNNSVQSLLKQYQVIEISFPVGSEPSNPIRLGEAIANDMCQQLKVNFAQNVSVDGKNDDMTYAVSTMMELRRFLGAYASTVTIKPALGVKLLKGDVAIFQGGSTAGVVSGQAPVQGNVIVEITEIGPNGVGQGIITQGDAKQLAGSMGYRLEKNVASEPIGVASYRNPRQDLGNALNETAKLVNNIPGFIQDAKNISNTGIRVLDNYNNGMVAVERTLSDIESAGSTIQSATSGLAGIDTSGLQNQIDNSSRAMGGLVGTLEVLKLVQADTGGAIDNLNTTRHNLDNMKNTLASLDSVAANARQAKTTIDQVVADANSTVAILKSFDANSARHSLTDADSRLDKIATSIDAPAITTQLSYLAGAVPNLKDEDISHTVRILDKFIAGQVIPGERIQILTTNDISVDAALPIVYRQAGHQNVALYSAAVGVIEPNARGELYRVLSEIKAILAGLTAIVVTVLFLVFDHTTVMSVMRRNRKVQLSKETGLLVKVKRFITGLIVPERKYGMEVGAIMLTAMFILAGGGIPYFPWIGVPILGALLGLIVASYCDKISPVATEEVVAGEALGLSYDEIMREIVIPSARPGLLQKLNSRKMKFN